MKSFTTLYKDALLVVEKCMQIQVGDKLLLIADAEHASEAQAVCGVATAKGAQVVIADVTPQVLAALASMKVSMEPPDHLAAAMLKSDVILITTNLEWANRFAHVNPVKQSCQNGVRIASIEEGMGKWDISAQDIDETVARSERIISALMGAKNVHITADNGTDVRLSIEGRPPLKVIPAKNPGDMMGPLPLWGEVAYAAREDDTEGLIVFDGIMLGVGVPGTLETPIEIVMKNGRAVQFRGGLEARKLAAVVEENENANIIGEFAIGTSQKAPLGNASEKGRLGVVHLALGDNWHCYPGGQNVSAVHLDGSIREATVEVDGQKIYDKGKLVI